jgi:hypothetical protein
LGTEAQNHVIKESWGVSENYLVNLIEVLSTLGKTVTTWINLELNVTVNSAKGGRALAREWLAFHQEKQLWH